MNTGMKPLAVEMKIKNGPLVQLMKLHNLSARKLADESGIGYATLCDYINLRRSPCSENPRQRGGLFTKSAMKLAAYFNLTPKEIFPEETWMPIERNEIEFFVCKRPDLSVLKEPQFLRGEQRKEFYRSLRKSLTDREYFIIDRAFGLTDGKPQSLAQIASALNVTACRAMQIQGRALRRLRHPIHSLRRIYDEANEDRSRYGRRCASQMQIGGR